MHKNILIWKREKRIHATFLTNICIGISIKLQYITQMYTLPKNKIKYVRMSPIIYKRGEEGGSLFFFKSKIFLDMRQNKDLFEH